MKGGLPRHKAVRHLIQRLRGPPKPGADATAVPIAEADALLRCMNLSREEALRAVTVANEMRVLRAQGFSYLEALRVLRRRVANVMNRAEARAAQSAESRKRPFATSATCPPPASSAPRGRARMAEFLLQGVEDNAASASVLGSGIVLKRRAGSPAQKRLKIEDGMDVMLSPSADQKRSRSDVTSFQSPMEMSPKRRRADEDLFDDV
uniref:Uncharacterized protein n=2 Tax=Phaeomonas parva TaxID=124430 RepID=A0A6U4CKH1_9STRA|mmetsp:Transcript_13747/g.40664  ORF Transcript_13747/g.40664 Transcript_13747/m.40664 type:complete len:207 (+) Transcript_13747:323-943(+)